MGDQLGGQSKQVALPRAVMEEPLQGEERDGGGAIKKDSQVSGLGNKHMVVILFKRGISGRHNQILEDEYDFSCDRKTDNWCAFKTFTQKWVKEKVLAGDINLGIMKC